MTSKYSATTTLGMNETDLSGSTWWKNNSQLSSNNIRDGEEGTKEGEVEVGLSNNGYISTNDIKSHGNNSKGVAVEKNVDLDAETRRRLAKPYPLSHKWTFFLDRYVANATPEEYEQNLTSLATVDTVQKFWSVYNNIQGPEHLQIRGSLHFMKNNILPLWEDQNNVNGGAWYFRVNKKDSPRVWRELLMLLIGEQFEDHLFKDDDIFGLSVSSRATSDIFTIWNKNSDVSQDSTVLEKLKSSLSPTELQMPYYKAHSEHATFKKTEPKNNNWKR